MTRTTHKRCRLWPWYVFSFLASIGPLAVVFTVNFREYVGTVQDAVKLGFGALAVGVFMLLKVLGKLKMPRRVVFFSLCLLFSYLFEAVLRDLMLISFAALLGEFLDYTLFQPRIARMKKARDREAVADATAEKMEEVLSRYIGGSGRV